MIRIFPEGTTKLCPGLANDWSGTLAKMALGNGL